MIVGAGLAGLIAAYAFPDHRIAEVKRGPVESHKALLRFRSSAVSDLTGIPFKPVTVHKGIWMRDKWLQPSIDIANMYSQKVLGKIIDRSIWNLSPATRWIAPETLYEQLLEHSAGKIDWGTSTSYQEVGTGPIISTAPMQAVTALLEWDTGEVFERASIKVKRFRVKNCDVYQTVYFPNPRDALYRASITGDLLICEFAGEPGDGWMCDVESAFAISDLEQLDSVSQSYGKIAPINEEVRQSIISRLTREQNVFSLGRFATWRNILLDDIINDIAVIKKLVTANSYRRELWQK